MKRKPYQKDRLGGFMEAMEAVVTILAFLFFIGYPVGFLLYTLIF